MTELEKLNEIYRMEKKSWEDGILSGKLIGNELQIAKNNLELLELKKKLTDSAIEEKNEELIKKFEELIKKIKAPLQENPNITNPKSDYFDGYKSSTINILKLIDDFVESQKKNGRKNKI